MTQFSLRTRLAAGSLPVMLSWLLLLALLLAFPTAPAQAIAFVPEDFTETLVAQGLRNPTNMAIAPDGRVFVLEQTTVSGQGRGFVRVVKNGALLPTPFVQINGINLSGERGLLGIVFDPNFASNGYLYLFYTVAAVTGSPLHNEVWRFTANPSNPDVVLSGSDKKVIQFPPIAADRHVGGSLHFSPTDGKLYISIGDDTLGSTTAQNENEFRGRMLRFTINANGTFTAPTDNPWYNVATTEINKGAWAIGLRNPYQFAFQPGTGLLYANDVGQDAYEEIDLIQRDNNYGWRFCEGPCSPPNIAYTNPIHYYGHEFGGSTNGGCAITGGTFYNPATPSFPASYIGKFFFSDYCNDWIKYLNPANPAQVTLFATFTHANPVALGVAPNGALYYLARGLSATDGKLFRIAYAPMSPPTFNQHPQSKLVSAGQTATFTCSATGDGTISYQWQRQNPGAIGFTNIGGATGTSYTTPVTTIQTDNGARYRCRASSTFGEAFSQSALLTVVQGTPPIITINVTANGTARQTWLHGDLVEFSFTASDAQDGVLPPSAFTWSVDLYHQPPASAVHPHPEVAPTTGSADGSFKIKDEPHDYAHLWYQINVRATDSSGLFTDAVKIVDSSLIAPTFNSEVTNTRPTLSWQPIPGAIGYEVYLGLTDIPDMVFPVSGLTTNFVLPRPLIATRTYHWYVKVLFSGGVSTATDTWRFHVVSAAAGAPIRDFFTTPQPTLSWSRISWAVGYRVQIATNTSFTGAALVYDETVTGNTTLEHPVNADPPLGEGVYYWRVAGVRADGLPVPFNPPQTFTIKLGS